MLKSIGNMKCAILVVHMYSPTILYFWLTSWTPPLLLAGNQDLLKCPKITRIYCYNLPAQSHRGAGLLLSWKRTRVWLIYCQCCFFLPNDSTDEDWSYAAYLTILIQAYRRVPHAWGSETSALALSLMSPIRE